MPEASSLYSSTQMRMRRTREDDVSDLSRTKAVRTAFVSRFIVLREGRRSRAHRVIEAMTWKEGTTAEELCELFRQAFVDNGDKLTLVDRDLRRALEHAHCSVSYFLDQYLGRSTTNFADALLDYQRSNELLFGEETDTKEGAPRSGGWRLPE